MKQALTDEQIDVLLDGVLRASGSALSSYTLQKSLYGMREAVRDIERAVCQQRGEPSGAKWYTQSRKGFVQGPCEDEAQATKFALMRSEAFPDYGPYIAICLAPVFAKPTAPQPAETTQGPSDDDLHNLWSRSGGVMRTFARALLARYGGARSSVPLTMGQRAVASELLSCFEAWEPGVRVLGNVQAKDGADLMEAVLAGARLCVPDGWKLVPVEPTREMLDAYVAQDGRFHSAQADWATMLAAAPSYGDRQ